MITIMKDLAYRNPTFSSKFILLVNSLNYLYQIYPYYDIVRKDIVCILEQV